MDSVITTVVGGVLKIELNRPEKLNAISDEMLDGLRNAIQLAESDAKVKCVTLTGRGRAFCAGGDVSNMGKRSTSETVERMRRTGNTVVARLLNLTKPVIVGVNGPAVGGGFSLALVGDVVLMSRDAYFALAFADRGLVPDMGATFLLPRLVGLLRAKEMAFSGRRIDAQESLELGLATKLTDSNDLESELQDFAVSIAGRPTFALSLTKRLLNQSFDSSLSAMLEAEAIAQGVAVTDPEHTEAVKAFMRRTQLRK